MAYFTDVIVDHFPPVSGVSIPVLSTIWIQFNRTMNTASLEEDFFVEGPDTDQFVGPGLVELQQPDNVSQGDLDNFLKSPGYAGIVQGGYTFQEVSGVGTKVIFTPDKPLAFSYDYTAHITDTLDINGQTISGHFVFGFQTGTGSVTELPSTISSSILNKAPLLQNYLESLSNLRLVKATPGDHSVENSVGTSEIVLEFNKAVDAASALSNISVTTYPATTHPSVSTVALGALATDIIVSGNQVTIKI